MSDRVSVEIADHIADVTLVRGDKMNAMDLAMFSALVDAADQISRDASVRAVVLHGEGGNLCAGIDTSVLSERDFDFKAALRTPLSPSPANLFQRATYAWRELPIPVICAIQGVAFGAGMQLALGADIRIAAADAKLSIMESKWGLIPDMGITTTLRHLVTPDKAKLLAWSARVVTASEAELLGLVTAIADDPLRASFELAAECAAGSPDAIRGIKSLLNDAWNLPEAEALAMEARLQEGIIGAENQLEAVAANLAKRKPNFRD